MLAKVEKIYDRFKELEQMMQLPDLASDGQKYAKVMKEYTSLSPIAEAYVAYKENQQAAEEARLIMEDSSADAELRELAEEEYRALRENERALRDELQMLLIPKDENDGKNVLVEIEVIAEII